MTTTSVSSEKTLYEVVAKQSAGGFEALETCYQLEKDKFAFAKAVQRICYTMRAALIQWADSQKDLEKLEGKKITFICRNNDELYVLGARIKQFYSGIFNVPNVCDADAKLLKKAKTALDACINYKAMNDESFHKRYLDLLSIEEFSDLKSLCNMPRSKL